LTEVVFSLVLIFSFTAGFIGSLETSETSLTSEAAASLIRLSGLIIFFLLTCMVTFFDQAEALDCFTPELL